MAKKLNPTMQIAETAHEADEVIHSTKKKQAGSDAVTNRLATVDDDNVPHHVKAKPAETVDVHVTDDFATPEPTMASIKAAQTVKQGEKDIEVPSGRTNPTLDLAATASEAAKRQK
ncbi:MAG: hypothetical protein AAGI92_04015 [Pseudomonadota bacterium]